MRLEIDGWSRGMFPHKLIDSPIEVGNIIEATKRCASGVNLAQNDGHILLRSKIAIKTSGEFDCRMVFSRSEVMIMAVQLLKDLSLSDVVYLMHQAGISVEHPETSADAKRDRETS